jgi:hypothetical protein
MLRDANGRCYYCGTKTYPAGSAKADDDPRVTATRDHITPKCDGGEEVVNACAYCNNIKSHEPVEVFIEFMKTNPPYEMRRQAFRDFKRVLLLEAIAARHEKADGYDFSLFTHQKGRYSLRELRKWNSQQRRMRK